MLTLHSVFMALAAASGVGEKIGLNVFFYIIGSASFFSFLICQAYFSWSAAMTQVRSVWGNEDVQIGVVAWNKFYLFITFISVASYWICKAYA